MRCHTIPGSTPKKTSGSGVKYETETEACLSVSPVKRDDNDDGTKFHKSEVLVDMSFSPGFLWKTLRILFLIGTFSVVVVNVACGKIIHIQAENNVDILHKNGMDLSQTVLNVIHHEVKERSTNEKTKSIIHVHVYKTLEAGEECSAGTQAIQDKCNNSEQALCVRNRTKKNLVAVCAPDMYMHDFCPVFTLATSNGSTFPIVQLDSHSQCVNCSDYYKRDVEKYPQCVKLEMDESTPATSSSNATSYSAGRDEKGLSGGHIAAIVTVAIVVLAVIIVVALFFLHRSGYIHIQSERLCQIWGQIRGWIFVNEN
ncbi:uncharacterized protein LOC134239794 [Saccostrea cucullata]|uniref:uncharacterized protein LOC134239794 n=1 Tax=Saccostrea cuccullata TaxID=36930 RepID=UPI002ED158CC